MCGRRTGPLGRLVLAAGIVGLFGSHAIAEEVNLPADSVQIGMVNTLFRDVPKSMLAIMDTPFKTLMRTQTGLEGEIVRADTADKLAQQLLEERVQLGVLFGFQYAQVRLDHPELRPLMIAVNQSRHLKANLIIRADDASTKDFADLKGKTLALPHRSREHCHFFLERRCEKCGQCPDKHFAKITRPSDAEEAMDDVVDGVVQAAVIDSLALECYKRRKPGRFERLKISQESEIFPATVIVYKPGAIDESTLQRFRNGMVNANKSFLGSRLLGLWKLTGFEPIPDDYDKTLDNILKAYPPPKKVTGTKKSQNPETKGQTAAQK